MELPPPGNWPAISPLVELKGSDYLCTRPAFLRSDLEGVIATEATNRSLCDGSERFVYMKRKMMARSSKLHAVTLYTNVCRKHTKT